MKFDYSGTWCNGLGATLTIEVQPLEVRGHPAPVDGMQVTGTFDSKVLGATSPVIGYVSHGLITFSNLFSDAVGSMIGQPKGDDGQSFQTWWLMRPFDIKPEDRWKAVSTNCDTWTRATSLPAAGQRERLDREGC